MPFCFGGLRELIDGQEVSVGLLNGFILWKLGAIYLGTWARADVANRSARATVRRREMTT